MAVERGEEILVNPSVDLELQDGDWVFVLALDHPAIVSQMTWES